MKYDDKKQLLYLYRSYIRMTNNRTKFASCAKLRFPLDIVEETEKIFQFIHVSNITFNKKCKREKLPPFATKNE